MITLEELRLIIEHDGELSEHMRSVLTDCADKIEAQTSKIESLEGLVRHTRTYLTGTDDPASLYGRAILCWIEDLCPLEVK